MSKNVDYEHKALLYAEKYGIVEYEVNDDIMSYYEVIDEGKDELSVYNATVDLNTMKEKRVQVK